MHELVVKILRKKLEIEESGKTPRVVIINNVLHDILKDEWLESISGLPWADSLEYEIQKQEKRNMFLADGVLFGLWVVRVNTIEDFMVY